MESIEVRGNGKGRKRNRRNKIKGGRRVSGMEGEKDKDEREKGKKE